MTIDVSKYTAHQNPGKFEGETAATEYFYEQMADGCGETIYAAGESDDNDEMLDNPCAELFQIDAEEAEAFDLPIGYWFLLRETDQGFAVGTVHKTREAAERRFNDWIG